MQNILIKKITAAVVIVAATAFVLVSCKKDSDGSPEQESGNPVARSLKPDSAAVGTVLTLQGSGLGDMRTIVFDANNAPVTFNSTLNTESAVVFRVPDTATRGAQNIIFTNGAGKKLIVPFKVLPFAVVNSAFPTDFEEGTLITLTGNNLDVMTKVVLTGTATPVQIISQSLNQAVVKMPFTTADKVRLTMTTSAGDKTTDMEFVNVANATQIFRDDFVNPAQSWSWGGSYAAATDFFITGTKSLKAAYDPAGAWGGLQIGMGSELPLPAGTKYFTFWVKGADVEKNIKLEIKGNNGNLTAPAKTLTIPPNKWTYFKEDISALIPGMQSISIILFQMHDAGKTVYFDNIMFTK